MQPIADIAKALASGTTTSRALAEEALARIEDIGGEGPTTFIRVFRDSALAAAAASDRLRAANIVLSPLAGVPVSIKDLCDVAGATTYAGSVVRRNAAPAKRDATVVARLRAAGAVIMGTTNMTEFAVGGLGLNPHYGDCRNPYDRETGRVPGRSSSGAAVSVTDGMAAAALGTDTAGSVRIPAAFCGLAGFKPTVGRVPTDGIFPLSTTLDSVGPLAPSVACCAMVDAVFAGEDPVLPEPIPLKGLRFGIPDTLVTDDLEPPVARAFENALRRLSAAGVQLEDAPLPELARISHQGRGLRGAVRPTRQERRAARCGDIGQADRTPGRDAGRDPGGKCGLGELAAVGRVRFPSMVEGYAIHRERLADSRDRMDPRITDRLLTGGEMSGPDYYDVLRFREDLMERAARITCRYDAVIIPTVPVIAPPISQFQGSDADLRDPHIVVIRNASIANLLGRCALTVPCHEPGEAPVGLMLMGEARADTRLLGTGISVEGALSPNA